MRRCRPNQPPSELAQRAPLPRGTATSARARSASSSPGSGGARRYDDALASGAERRARWRSTTNSRRRSCATTSSSTGAWAPSPRSSGSITPPSSGCWARPGSSASASARVAPRSSTPTERARVASGTSGAFITETLERFPTLTAARLFDMVKARGYTGGPDHFRHRIAQLRPRRPREAYLRLRTLAGEQAQV